MRLLLLFGLLVTSSLAGDGHPRVESQEEKLNRKKAELQPVIAFVDNFIKQNHRLPTSSEFRAVADKLAWMVVIRDREDDYARTHGAKTELDYMIGIWRSEWYLYFKSWDKHYLDASDERSTTEKQETEQGAAANP